MATTHTVAAMFLTQMSFFLLACGSGGSNPGPIDPDPPVEERGSLRVTTMTEGDPYSRDRDGFTVAVDDEELRRIAVIGTVNFLDLSVGAHVVELEDAEENCVIAGDNPRTAAVLPGLATDVPFSITCATLTGNLAVKTLSSGAVDPNGYTVTISGNPAGPIGTNETKTYLGLATGRQEVLLGGMDGGCTLQGPNPRIFFLYGRLDTTVGTTLNFNVSC